MEIISIPTVEELLEECISTDIVQITWTDRFNIEQDIRKMDEGHLFNLSKWLVRKKLPRTKEIIDGEIECRLTDRYPSNFDELVEAYKNNPETWRLKVKIC